ncbi:MAG: PIG-L family deacetylase [Anaerolineales bacterium]|nr:PIG-L family deacetylase [Anaerolineales bacterium]
MPTALTHIYLSPHLDDAVLSCGGLLHRQALAQARVVVVTLCAGNPPAGPLSEFAQTLHVRWAADRSAPAAPVEMAAARRAEDLAALADLRVEAVHLDVPDCIYRLNPATHWPMYASEAALFGSLHPAELPLVRRAAARLTTLLHGLGRHRLYVPLGIGQHVDHQLARRAAEVVGGIYAYFEDYPYVAREGDRWPNASLTQAHDRPLTPELIPLADADLGAQVRAVSRYASQITSFWPDLEAMAAALGQFAAHTGGGTPALRLWRAA